MSRWLVLPSSAGIGLLCGVTQRNENGSDRVKLTAKLLLAILAVFGGSLAANIWILNATVAPSFAELERDQALEDARRIVEALRREGAHLDTSVRDWAYWDDSYEFAQGNNDTYVDENLYAGTLEGLSVNALYLLDRQGTVLWRLLLDLDTGEELTASDLPSDHFAADHPILTLRPADRPFHGLMETQAGLMVISAAPILTNERQGPPAGTFILGRLLTAGIIDRLKDQTGVDFTLIPLAGDGISEADRQAVAGLTQLDPIAIEPAGDDTLIVRTLLHDLEGAPAALLRVSVPRDIARIGQETEETAVLLMILAGFLVLLTVGILARATIIAPLNELTRHVAKVGKTGKLSEMKMAKRSDEFGLLAREFDTMLRQLEGTRERLIEQSYYSGRTESAAGVMHNVRNALNPINLILWHITATLKDRNIANLKQSVAELQDDRTPAERRAKLWTFLDQSVRSLDEERRQILSDVDEIADQHRNVDAILVEHDAFNRFGRPVEQVDLADVLTEAAQVVPLGGKSSVTINWPSSMPRVMAHRILLSQILSNLFVNALEAIAATGRDRGEIWITCAREETPHGPTVEVTVTDDGEGISSDRLKMIFERGHSSRTHKMGGLGLHWCANSLAGMGGRISASSDGPGKGAAFHVCLPAATDLVREVAE